MKIISYNINGLNRFLTSARFRDLLADYPSDVYCFQEVKVQNPLDMQKIISVCYYDRGVLTASSQNKEKKGYAGVVTIFNTQEGTPTFHENSVEEKVFECSIADQQKYMGGRVITVEYDDFYLINTYVPNSGNKETLRREWDTQFKAYIKSLNKPVIIVGDMNVCATELDYWGKYNKAINTSPGLMDFEIEGFKTLCNECNLVDAFRYTHTEERKYSWYSTRNKFAVEKNQGWRLDYVLVSNELKDRIVNCDIMQGYQSPDHSPIIIEIK